MNLKLNADFLVQTNKTEIEALYQAKIAEIFAAWEKKTSPGAKDWSGWIKWVQTDHEAQIQAMEAIREEWMGMGVKTVVCIGIGGSYIGTRAGLEWSQGFFAQTGLEIIFVPSFSASYLGALLKKLAQEKFGIVVISKSGTTLEVAVAFRLLRTLLYKQHSDNVAQKLIVAVTDRSKGVLRDLVTQNKYKSFVVEDDIGGRFSSLTAVGLLPNVLAGIDVRQYLLGAQKACAEFYHGDIKTNLAAFYAAVRHFMFTHGHKTMECLCSYDPDANFLIEKAKQLFGESEGKNNQGLMPVLLNFTTDLHSVGQLLQQGAQNFFETIIRVQKPKYNLLIEKSLFDNDDQLDWLVGKDVGTINEQAFFGTLQAHSQDANVDCLVLELDNWSLSNFGYFYFFLCVSAVFSAYLLEVNPFDQPGVEAYKARMFALLKQ